MEIIKYEAKKDFYNSLQNRRRLDSDNKRFHKQIYSAGILPFSIKNNTIYFLLGTDPENKWSDFGGRCEVSDKGRWDSTATREFYEESIGSVMDIPTMLVRLQHKKNFIRVRGKTLNGSAYFMYCVKIPYKESYRETFNSILTFLDYSKGFDKKYFEKTDIQWVSLETIYASLENNNNNSVINFPLRKVFRKTLLDNLSIISKFPVQFFEPNPWHTKHKLSDKYKHKHKTYNKF